MDWTRLKKIPFQLISDYTKLCVDCWIICITFITLTQLRSPLPHRFTQHWTMVSYVDWRENFQLFRLFVFICSSCLSSLICSLLVHFAAYASCNRIRFILNVPSRCFMNMTESIQSVCVATCFCFYFFRVIHVHMYAYMVCWRWCILVFELCCWCTIFVRFCSVLLLLLLLDLTDVIAASLSMVYLQFDWSRLTDSLNHLYKL